MDEEKYVFENFYDAKSELKEPLAFAKYFAAKRSLINTANEKRLKIKSSEIDIIEGYILRGVYPPALAEKISFWFLKEGNEEGRASFFIKSNGYVDGLHGNVKISVEKNSSLITAVSSAIANTSELSEEADKIRREWLFSTSRRISDADRYYKKYGEWPD